nr:2856_t:CDS:2 [Entrophospora candida]
MKHHFKEHGTMDCLFEPVEEIENKEVKQYLTKIYRDYQIAKKQVIFDFSELIINCLHDEKNSFTNAISPEIDSKVFISELFQNLKLACQETELKELFRQGHFHFVQNSYIIEKIEKLVDNPYLDYNRLCQIPLDKEIRLYGEAYDLVLADLLSSLKKIKDEGSIKLGDLGTMNKKKSLLKRNEKLNSYLTLLPTIAGSLYEMTTGQKIPQMTGTIGEIQQGIQQIQLSLTQIINSQQQLDQRLTALETNATNQFTNLVQEVKGIKSIRLTHDRERKQLDYNLSEN